MKWYPYLYVGEGASKKKNKIIRKLKIGAGMIDVWVITEAANGEDQLDILSSGRSSGTGPADPSDRFVFASAVSHMCRKTRGTEKKYCKRQCELAVWHPEGKSRLSEWADILCTADFRKKDRFR